MTLTFSIIFVLILFFVIRLFRPKRLNSYYVYYFRDSDNEIILDHEPFFFVYNANLSKFIKRRNDAVGKLQVKYSHRNPKLVSITATLNKMNDHQGFIKVDGTYRSGWNDKRKIILNLNNWRQKKIKNLFNRVNTNGRNRYEVMLNQYKP